MPKDKNGIEIPRIARLFQRQAENIAQTEQKNLDFAAKQTAVADGIEADPNYADVAAWLKDRAQTKSERASDRLKVKVVFDKLAQAALTSTPEEMAETLAMLAEDTASHPVPQETPATA